MTPELIGILAVGVTVIGLLITVRRDVRADLAEVRADNQRLREEVRADFAQVRGDLADLRQDVQALTERTSRLEGAIEGFFVGRAPRDRHDDAA